MSKDVDGLLAHCKQALKNNVQYVYGAKMQVNTYMHRLKHYRIHMVGIVYGTVT